MDDDHPNDSFSKTMAHRWARRIERCCCTCATYFPLFFVYGLTTWAVWVVVHLGSKPSSKTPWLGTTSSLVGVALYGMLNWSYTTAVFTDPGSTTGTYALAKRGGYSALPTHNTPNVTNLTVKSNGELRFCKKCHARKPDRAHHCSTCRRCVLKMDHHCPWLATCIGLRNHKAFLLFLIYTTFFCFYSFACAGSWTWVEMFSERPTYDDSTFMPINYIMLSVIAGIIGIVVGAFAGWHILLASRGQTTIECLEKTRYLSPLRKQLQSNFNVAQPNGTNGGSYGQQLFNIHANALPGITRPEEGEDYRHESVSPSSIPISASSQPIQPLITAPLPPSSRTERPPGASFSYAELERYQARKRHEAYIDEQDSSKMPHAFDLGAKRNFLHLFGEHWYLWLIPICNTTGDGWNWEPSIKWIEVRDSIAREREEQKRLEQIAGWGGEATSDYTGSPNWTTERSQGAGRFYDTPSAALVSPYADNGDVKIPSKADRVLGRDPNLYADSIQPSKQRKEADLKMKRLSHLGIELLESDDDVDGFIDDEEESLAKGRDYSSNSNKPTAGPSGNGPVKGLVLQRGVGVGASGLLRKHTGSISPSSNSVPSPMRSPVRTPLPGDDNKSCISASVYNPSRPNIRNSEDDEVD